MNDKAVGPGQDLAAGPAAEGRRRRPFRSCPRRPGPAVKPDVPRPVPLPARRRRHARSHPSPAATPATVAAGPGGAKLPAIPPPPPPLAPANRRAADRARAGDCSCQEPENLPILPRPIGKADEKKEPPPKKRKILGNLSQEDEIKLNAAQNAARLGDFNRAAALMAEVIASNPDEYDLRAEFAGILLSAGRRPASDPRTRAGHQGGAERRRLPAAARRRLHGGRAVPGRGRSVHVRPGDGRGRPAAGRPRPGSRHPGRPSLRPGAGLHPGRPTGGQVPVRHQAGRPAGPARDGRHAPRPRPAVRRPALPDREAQATPRLARRRPRSTN